MGRVEGKVVVVTGAAGGQGAAEARRSRARARPWSRPTSSEDDPGLGDGIAYRRLDVAHPEDWRALGAWLEETHGRVDGLVNNAGIPFRARVLEVELADWNRVIGDQPDRAAARHPDRRAAHARRRVDRQRQLDRGADGALRGRLRASASGAVRGLSRVASLELGAEGIRVNTILPGLHRDADDGLGARVVPRREHRARRRSAAPARPTRWRRSSST